MEVGSRSMMRGCLRSNARRSSESGTVRLGRLLAAASAAAALMYVLDPDRGAARRARLAEGTLSTVRHGGRRALRIAHHLTAEAGGLLQRLVHLHPYRAVDERTFLDHVETELLGHPDVPKGRINVDVEKGVVVLRGQLDSDQIALVERRTRAISGVRGFTSFLHVAGTPAPNKAAALRANGAAEQR
jgi:BON domain